MMTRREREVLERRVIPLGTTIVRAPNVQDRKPDPMDSSIIRRTVVLTGARRDFTGRLGDFPVVNGRIKLAGVPKDLLAWERYLEVMYQGFPLGDPRIEEHEQAIVAALTGEQHGESRFSTGGFVPNGEAHVHGDDAQGSTGAPEGAGLGSVDGGPPAGPTDADAAVRNRHEEVVTPVSPRLVAALARLDDADPTHWTQAGLPMISQVEKFLGSAGITRAMIEGASDRRRVS